MPRPRKNMETTIRSFSVEKSAYERLRALLSAQNRSLSEEVNELLKKRLAELEGSQPAQEADYEALKREYSKLVEDTKRLTRMLKDMGSFEAMHSLAVDCGLDFKDMHNADEVAAKLLATTDIPEDALHTYISLLEVAKKKREVGGKLAEIRLQKYSTEKMGN